MEKRDSDPPLTQRRYAVRVHERVLRHSLGYSWRSSLVDDVKELTSELAETIGVEAAAQVETATLERELAYLAAEGSGERRGKLPPEDE